MIESGALGKKVFFLYPHPVLSDVVEELARKEFEVYLARDHAKLARVLPSEPESIVFINIDDGMDEPSWESYVRGLRSEGKTVSVGVGILSMNEDQALREKYLMDLQVPCGFVTVKIGAAKTVEILTKTLEANEARGRRKFVRATCSPGSAQCALDLDGRNLRGSLSDLSSAGMALALEGESSLRPGTVLRGLTLTVRGVRVSVDGFIAAKRDAGEVPTYIVMFDPSTIDDAKRDKLRSLVSKLNQSAMDKVLETA
jgi:hypothetical protein